MPSENIREISRKGTVLFFSAPPTLPRLQSRMLHPLSAGPTLYTFAMPRELNHVQTEFVREGAVG